MCAPAAFPALALRRTRARVACRRAECGLQPGMHWMMDWELKQLIREGSPSERGLACPQCRTPIQFARKLKWIQVATEAPARRRRAAVRIQARVRMRQVRKRVRATKGLE